MLEIAAGIPTKEVAVRRDLVVRRFQDVGDRVTGRRTHPRMHPSSRVKAGELEKVDQLKKWLTE